MAKLKLRIRYRLIAGVYSDTNTKRHLAHYSLVVGDATTGCGVSQHALRFTVEGRTATVERFNPLTGWSQVVSKGFETKVTYPEMFSVLVRMTARILAAAGELG